MRPPRARGRAPRGGGSPVRPPRPRAGGPPCAPRRRGERAGRTGARAPLPARAKRGVTCARFLLSPCRMTHARTILALTALAFAAPAAAQLANHSIAVESGASLPLAGDTDPGPALALSATTWLDGPAEAVVR